MDEGRHKFLVAWPSFPQLLRSQFGRAIVCVCVFFFLALIYILSRCGYFQNPILYLPIDLFYICFEWIGPRWQRPFNIQMTQVNLDKTSVVHALIIAEMQLKITKRYIYIYLLLQMNRIEVNRVVTRIFTH